MKRWISPLLIAGLMPAVAAAAEDGSRLKMGPSSTQIRKAVYSAMTRIEITGVVGEPTTIKFPSNENVLRVVQTSKVGPDGTLQPDGWGLPKKEEADKDMPLGNVLTLWPIHPGYSTMTVTTCMSALGVPGCKDGSMKPYAFRLKAINDDGIAAALPEVTLNLIFEGGGPATDAAPTTLASYYSDDGPPVKKVSKRKQREEAEAAVARDRLRVDAFNGVAGCHYEGKGVPNAITPLCPLDNGQQTLMRFPGLSQKPAVYVLSAGLCGDDRGANERLARQHSSGDFIVVEEIAASFCLRLGTNVLQITNLAYNPAGTPTDTGTLAPSVVRGIIKAQAQ